MHKVKINHVSLANATIEVDGRNIAEHVTEYELKASFRDGPRLTVHFTPALLPEWDGLTEVEVSEELAAVLVLFGWQPPVKGEVTEAEITALNSPHRVFLRSDGTYRTEPWHIPVRAPEPALHQHKASCHGTAGEVLCGHP